MPRALAPLTSLPASRERVTPQKSGIERSARKGRKATLHNKHDVKRLETQISALLMAIRAHLPEGRDIGMQLIEASARSYALARLLVQKGLMEESEIQAEMLASISDILAGVLQGMEEQTLRQARVQQQQQQQAQQGQGPQVQAVRMPPLVVARR